MSVSQLDTIIADLEAQAGQLLESGYQESDVSQLAQSIQEHMGKAVTVPGLSGTNFPTLTIPDLQYKTAPEKPQLEKNTLYGYACWHYDATGDYFVDPYGDITVPGSWQDTIAEAEQTRKATGRGWLIPHLFNHSKDSVVGAVVALREDHKGIYYESKLANTSKAREVKSLASDGLLGASYGYNPLMVQHFYHERSKKTVRKLLKVQVGELSATAIPANPYTTAGVKSLFPMLQASGYHPDTIKRLFTQLDDKLTTLQLQAARARE